MKTNILRSIGILCSVMVAVVAFSAFAGDGATAKEKTATGTVTTVDSKDKVLKIKQVLFSKTFVVSDAATLMLGDRKVGLAEFQPGQRVQVSYRDASGVLVASRIAQEKLTYSGQVSGLDLPNHTITIHQRGSAKVFTLADNCAVVLNGNSKGSYPDVKLGSRVTIVYELPNNQLLARQIEQKSLSFTGTLSAVSLTDRTVTAGKRLLGDKTFHLASDCVIVKDGTLEGRLNDLRVGRAYELSYESVDGVNVVNRIAPAPADKSDTSSSSGGAPEQVKNNN